MDMRSQHSHQGTGRAYTRITQEEFEGRLGSLASYEVVDERGTNEVVYRISLPSDDLEVRIYSTIERGVSRDKGSDAIRTVVFDTNRNVVVGGRTKTLRLESWFDNLRPKILDLFANWRQYDYDDCDKCHGRFVERDGKFGKFLGCSNFPNCKNTRQLD